LSDCQDRSGGWPLDRDVPVPDGLPVDGVTGGMPGGLPGGLLGGLPGGLP
jgi:hypothetical protein